MKVQRIRNLFIVLIVFTIIGSQLLVVAGKAQVSEVNQQLSQQFTSDMDAIRIKLKNVDFDPLKMAPYIPKELRANSENTYYLVQLNGKIQSVWINELEALGARVLDYVPDYAYVVQMDDQTKNTVAQLPFVRWIDHYHPFYKISSDLNDRSDILELNVIVFESDDDRNRLKVIDRLEALGGLITYDGFDNGVVRVKIGAGMIRSIVAIPEVAWIDEFSEPKPVMNKIRVFTGAEMLHLNGFNGSGIVGEVKDNGIDEDHPDFLGQLIGLDGSPTVQAHGTSTFGIVFSSGKNNQDAMGMLPGAGGVFADWWVSRTASIQNLVDNWNGTFQSNSWSQGSTNGWYSSFSRTDDRAVFDYDVTMLYSAGNAGGTQSMAQDASAKNVIAVGGVLHYDDTDRTNDIHIEGLSGNQGPAADGRIKPDICGPYDSIYTTDVVGSGGYSGGNYYSQFGGTSGAAPVTAGAVGLLYQMYKENFFANNPNGSLPHASTVKAILIANAYQYDFSYADRYEQGWGLVDIGNVYDTGQNHFIIDQDISLQTGESVSFNITPTDSKPLKISLVWTDPAGASWSNPALVNNLDLKVTGPNGTTVYWGNDGLTDSKWSASTGKIDTLNNVENVFIEHVNSSDLWVVEVIADNIAKDGNINTTELDQHFALVVSGGAIDEVPPYTTHDLTGVQGDNGWFTSPSVMVTLNPTDNLSGIARTNYNVDGGQWFTYTSPFFISSDGYHVVEYYSTDCRGNVESVKTAYFKIDSGNPDHSAMSPMATVTYDSFMDSIRLRLDWTDATSWINDVKFRYRFDFGLWTTWENYTGMANDTYWYDVPRTIWINQIDAQLDWESYGIDDAGLTTYTSTLNGTTILDDDTSPPTFSDLFTIGDRFDSYMGDYRLQINWYDVSGISSTQFRYRNDTLNWSAWFNNTGSSDSTYWYHIPRSVWIDFVGSDIYWESKAVDDDDDRANDTSEGTTIAQFAGSITDDDTELPIYSNPYSDGDIFDSHNDSYRLQIDWTDSSWFSELVFRYSNNTSSWSPWYNYSDMSGNTYWYDIPRSEWLKFVDSQIYWESKAIDGDTDRANDTLENFMIALFGGNITDDDNTMPSLEDFGAEYDADDFSYTIWVKALDESGWTLNVEYYYLSPDTIYSVENNTSEQEPRTLNIKIGKTELKQHNTETLYWRYRVEDNDHDRANDSLNTSWSEWIQGFTIDLSPPTTNYTLDGNRGPGVWFVSRITVTLTAEDDISGVDFTKYSIDDNPWLNFSDPFRILESGIHSMKYYSVDKAGNVELINLALIYIDTELPEPHAVANLVVTEDTDVILDGSKSKDNFGIQEYEWEITKEGRTIEIFSGIMPVYSFRTPGDYEVILTVTDFVGNTNETEIQVQVLEREESSWMLWWFIIIIISIIVIISVVAVALYVRRKRKEK